jgi:hypothetical protein
MDTLMRNELLSNRKKILNLDDSSSQENIKLNIVIDDHLFSENNNDEYIEIDDIPVKPVKHDFNNTIKLMENSINSNNRLYASLTLLGMLGLFVINDVILIHFYR